MLESAEMITAVCVEVKIFQPLCLKPSIEKAFGNSILIENRCWGWPACLLGLVGWMVGVSVGLGLLVDGWLVGVGIGVDMLVGVDVGVGIGVGAGVVTIANFQARQSRFYFPILIQEMYPAGKTSTEERNSQFSFQENTT